MSICSRQQKCETIGEAGPKDGAESGKERRTVILRADTLSSLIKSLLLQTSNPTNYQTSKIDHPYTAFYFIFFNLYWFMCSFCIMHQNPMKIHSQGKGSGRDWEVFCVYSVLWLFQIWNEQTYQKNRRDPSILHLIFMWSLPGMSECLKLTPLLFCSTGKAEKAECKALQGSKTTGLTMRA